MIQLLHFPCPLQTGREGAGTTQPLGHRRCCRDWVELTPSDFQNIREVTRICLAPGCELIQGESVSCQVDSVDFENEKPLIVCGCPGSGSSRFAEMLRYCGIFLGADTGDVEGRVLNESEGLKKVNQFWLGQLIDFSHAPKGAHQFRELQKLIPSRTVHLVNSIDIELLMRDFFRGEMSVTNWGWTDPRNSATAAIWKKVFPRARVVVMERQWNDRFRDHPSGTDAANWYFHESTEEIRHCYEHPVCLAADEIIRVDFDRLMENEQELNRFLLELGMTECLVADFGALRKKIGLTS